MTAKQPTGMFLSHEQLRDRYGGRSDRWALRQAERDPRFPKPIRIGRRLFWRLAEVEAFERQLAARRIENAESGDERRP